jgi:hypothetical protein
VIRHFFYIHRTERKNSVGIQEVNGILTIMYVGADPVIPISLLAKLRDGTMQKLHQMIED